MSEISKNMCSVSGIAHVLSCCEILFLDGFYYNSNFRDRNSQTEAGEVYQLEEVIYAYYIKECTVGNCYENRGRTYDPHLELCR